MCAQMVEQGAFHGALSKSSWISFLSSGTFETCFSATTISYIKHTNNSVENGCICLSLLLSKSARNGIVFVRLSNTEDAWGICGSFAVDAFALLVRYQKLLVLGQGASVQKPINTKLKHITTQTKFSARMATDSDAVVELENALCNIYYNINISKPG